MSYWSAMLTNYDFSFVLIGIYTVSIMETVSSPKDAGVPKSPNSGFLSHNSIRLDFQKTSQIEKDKNIKAKINTYRIFRKAISKPWNVAQLIRKIQLTSPIDNMKLKMFLKKRCFRYSMRLFIDFKEWFNERDTSKSILSSSSIFKYM